MGMSSFAPPTQLSKHNKILELKMKNMPKRRNEEKKKKVKGIRLIGSNHPVFQTFFADFFAFRCSLKEAHGLCSLIILHETRDVIQVDIPA